MERKNQKAKNGPTGLMEEIMETAVEKRNEASAQAKEERPVQHRIYSPAVDLYRKDDTFYVYADIPGASENSVDVSVEKNILTIKEHK